MSALQRGRQNKNNRSITIQSDVQWTLFITMHCSALHCRAIHFRFQNLPVLVPCHFGFIGTFMPLLFAYQLIFRFDLFLPVNTNFTIIFWCHFAIIKLNERFSHSIFNSESTKFREEKTQLKSKLKKKTKRIKTTSANNLPPNQTVHLVWFIGVENRNLNLNARNNNCRGNKKKYCYNWMVDI